MAQVKLTALKSGVPIGFMAALGAFRHATETPELGTVRLGWTASGGQWCAVLETSNSVSADRMVELITERLKRMDRRNEFTWATAVKNTPPEVWRRMAEEALNTANACSHQLPDWLQAFASELVKKEDGLLEPTPLDMTGAAQKFLEGAAKLTIELQRPHRRLGDSPLRDSFHEALFGPWRYLDDQHSLGWDPSMVALGAFSPQAPTKMKNTGVRTAVWLAMESLPFFPCFYEKGLATCGFVKTGRKQSFRWAVWESPLSVCAVRTLLAQEPGIPEEEKSGRGLCAMYESAVYKPNKYMTSFQSAVLQA